MSFCELLNLINTQGISDDTFTEESDILHKALLASQFGRRINRRTIEEKRWIVTRRSLPGSRSQSGSIDTPG